MACVDLPFLPLQVLLRRRPDWQRQPVAVVDQDKPQGRILWVNDAARAARILPGMRYAAALGLEGRLRAAVVAQAEIDAAVAEVGERLRRFTPHVEPATDEPGIFWLDATGLQRLYESLRSWAGDLRAELRQASWQATVVVGFSRFGTYALARGRRGVLVLRSPEDERAAMGRVPLDRLAFDPQTRDALERLGVTTVGGFAELPVEGVARRFDERTLRWHRLATGELGVPVQADLPLPPATERLALDHPETSVARLLVAIERLLPPLVKTLDARGQALAELQIGFRFDRLGDHLESLRPAAPTLDAARLLELARLRLEAVRRLPDGVVEIVLMAGATAAAPRQATLLDRPRRDPVAAARALARVRAALGDEAVVRARLREGHLPEARFEWEKAEELPAARPREAPETARLVRRLHLRPVPLPPRPRHEPDGWMLHGLEQGPVTRVAGPYVVAGGWWNRPVHREYHFAETRRGDLLWVYYDRPRRRWFLQGRVE